MRYHRCLLAAVSSSSSSIPEVETAAWTLNYQATVRLPALAVAAAAGQEKTWRYRHF